MALTSARWSFPAAAHQLGEAAGPTGVSARMLRKRRGGCGKQRSGQRVGQPLEGERTALHAPATDGRETGHHPTQPRQKRSVSARQALTSGVLAGSGPSAQFSTA